MKRILSLTLAGVLVLSLLALAACGGGNEKQDLSDSEYLGEWKADSMSLEDASEEIGDDWILTLNEDGTGTLEDGDDKSEFTWQPTDGGFKTKGDVKMDFKGDGEKIKGKILGADLVFVRK